MLARGTSEDPPPERSARPDDGRATLSIETVADPRDPAWPELLRGWLRAIDTLERWPLSPPARARLDDCRRITAELADVLEGRVEGEGRAADRTLHVARGAGRIQALASMFACPGGTFVELLATAPWNVLGDSDPHDDRTQRGAGSALVARAVAWSRRRGLAGRVALQAENPRALGFYRHLGFRPLTPTDAPLALVPAGERGWSPEVQRVAQGTPGPEEQRMPWLVLEPDRAAPEAREVTPSWRASPAA